jgi:transposase
VVYTLVANCRLQGVDPCAYLKNVLELLPTATNQTVAQLTPLNWKRALQVPVKLAA